jgi:type IV secretory pathway VirB9-like protein
MKLPFVIAAMAATMVIGMPRSYAQAVRIDANVLQGTIPALSAMTCQAFTVCQIILDEGETINKVSVGDGDSWAFDQQTDERNQVHLMLKSRYPATETNLLVFTNRRHFEVELTSPPSEKKEKAK